MIYFESFTYQEVLALKFGVSGMGMPVLYTHLYYIDGLLIDTGQRKARAKILAETQKLKIDQLFITHHHEDHTGNIQAIRSAHDCPAYASQRCCDMMKNPPGLSLAQRITCGNGKSFQDLIVQEDTLSTPHFTFQIIPIPGHAPDMVALYEPERRWLFSADLYLNSNIDYFIRTESTSDQIASIRNLLTLDFEVLFCSHKPQLKDGKAQLQKKLHFLESFYEKVAQLYDQGHNAREIFRLLELKENRMVSFLSGGYLSKMNMVRSVIRDKEK